MNLLFLDDDVMRQKKFRSNCPWATIVSTTTETVDKLQQERFSVVCLDHDLGGEVFVDSDREDTGMEVVRWIINNKPSIELIIVHSLNYNGALNMECALRSNGYNVIRVPFTSFVTFNVYTQLQDMKNAKSQDNR